MPRPVYIIAAESVSQDGRTNALSIFNVIERIEFEPIQPSVSVAQILPPSHTNLAKMFVVAVWMKLPTDEQGQPYQHQMVIWLPDGTERIVADDPNVLFNDDDTPLNRYGIVFTGSPPFAPGLNRIESRMRRNGDIDWISQDYPIALVQTQPIVPAEQNAQVGEAEAAT